MNGRVFYCQLSLIASLEDLVNTGIFTRKVNIPVRGFHFFACIVRKPVGTFCFHIKATLLGLSVQDNSSSLAGGPMLILVWNDCDEPNQKNFDI